MGFKSNSEKCERCPASCEGLSRDTPAHQSCTYWCRQDETQLDFCEYLTRPPSTASPTVYYPEKRIFERIEDTLRCDISNCAQNCASSYLFDTSSDPFVLVSRCKGECESCKCLNGTMSSTSEDDRFDFPDNSWIEFVPLIEESNRQILDVRHNFPSTNTTCKSTYLWKIPAVPSPSPSVIASKAPTPLANAQPSEYEYPLTMTFDKVPYSFKCNGGEEESAKESKYYECTQSYTIDKRNDPYKMVLNCNSGSCRTPCPNSLRSSSNETNVYHSEDKKYWYKVRVVAEEEEEEEDINRIECF